MKKDDTCRSLIVAASSELENSTVITNQCQPCLPLGSGYWF